MRIHRISVEAERERKKRILKAEHIMLVVIAVTIVIISLNILGVRITGFAAYQADTAIWDFSNPAEYTFNANEVQVSSGAQLILQSQTATWEEEVTSAASLTSAVYNGEDKLSKVSSKNDNWLTANKNKIFDITFSHSLSNGDIIRLYLKQADHDEPDITVCDASTACGSPGHGLISFGGAEDWYEITLSGLNSPDQTFNLNPTDKYKVDYIEARYTETIEHSNTTQAYPSSAVIETDEAVVENFSSWGIFSAVSVLNGQSINYFYSADSGLTWTSISFGDDLSSVESNKMKFKAELTSDGSATPVLTSLSVSYSTCTESWVCTDWLECLQSGTQTRICTDINSCGTAADKPEEEQSCESACIEEWSCTFWSPEECPQSETQTRTCEDLNICGTELNKPNETQSCEYQPPAAEAYNIIINSSNSQLEISASEQVNESEIEITESSSSNVANAGAAPANKYISINTDANQKIKWGIIKMYYINVEIAGLNESSLKIYYLNETDNSWTALESTVVADENYVWANVTHFSTYGLFGEPLPAEQPPIQQSSPNTGGGGGGSSRGSGSHISEPATAPEASAAKEEAKPESTQESKQPVKEIIQESASKVVGAATKTAADVYEAVGISGVIILFIACFAVIVLLDRVRKRM